MRQHERPTVGVEPDLGPHAEDLRERLRRQHHRGPIVGADAARPPGRSSDRSGAPPATGRGAPPARRARCRRSARSRSSACSWCARSRPAIGSSSSRSGASWASARARCTRCRSPPDSSATGRAAERRGVGRLQRALDRLDVGGPLGLKAIEVRQPAERHRLAHAERQIDRRVLRQERRAARDLAGATAPRPARPRAAPARADGACRPSSSRRSVDFPAPFGPQSATSSPGRIASATSSKIGRGP